MENLRSIAVARQGFSLYIYGKTGNSGRMGQLEGLFSEFPALAVVFRRENRPAISL
jgi:hypothetical protein